VQGSCEDSNEPLGSINVGKFLSSRTTGGFSGFSSIKLVSWSVS
jgi:hypothetical protein